MAWGTKYKIEYKDYLNVDWKVEFQIDGYTDAEISLTPGVKPMMMYERPGDHIKYSPIIGSYCDIQLVYESNIDDLYTENSLEIKVIVRMDSTIIWYGYLSPGQYTRHFNQPKHYVTLTASDGLGELKGIKWLTSSDEPFYLQGTDIAIIAVCLLETGTGVNINDAIDIFETDFNATASDSPLAQTYSYREKYWDEVTGESADVYTVLSGILRKYGASIRQNKAEWWLYRPNSLNVTSIRYRVFNAIAQYQSNDTHTGYRSLSQLGMVYIHADAELTKLPGVGSCEVTLNPPMRSNLLKNGTFDDFTWDGATPSYWTNSGATIGHASDADVLDIGSCANSTQPTEYLYTTFNTYKAQSARLTLQWKAVYAGSPTYARLMIVIKCGSWYYLTNNTWTKTAPPTSTGWQYDLIADSKNSMTEFEELTLDLPTIIVGTYGIIDNWEIRLYEFWNENAVGTNYWAIKNARFEVSYDSTIVPTKVFTFDGPNTINSIEKIEITQGDSFLLALGLSAGYNDMFYNLSSATGDGDLTAEWYIMGDNPTVTTPVPIAELLAKQRVEGFTRSLDVLNASFRCGSTLETFRGIQDTNFTDEYGFTKTFCYTNLERDTRMAIYKGTWVEVPVTYTDEEMEWDSHDCGGDAVITGNEIEINSWTNVGGGNFAYFDSYTAVAGETIRLVVNMVNDGASNTPWVSIDGDVPARAFGLNYFTHYFATAGVKDIEIGSVASSTMNCTVTIDLYSITGI